MLPIDFYTYIWFRGDGTPYYVGKGRGRRAYNWHERVGTPIRSRVVVENWATEEEAYDKERWYIRLFGRKDTGTGILRNMTDGGDAPPSVKGIPFSPEHKERIRQGLKGKPKSVEHCAALKANHANFKKENHPQFGRKHSPEQITKRLLSLKANGNRWKLSEETKQKMRKPKSPEHRAKLAEHLKRVRYVPNG